MQRIAMSLIALALVGAGACSEDETPSTSNGGSSGSGGTGGTGGRGGSGGGSGGNTNGGSSGAGGGVTTGGTSGAGGGSGGAGGAGGGSGGASGDARGSGGASGDGPRGSGGSGGGSGDAGGGMGSFFITSRTGSGDLGGLAGADKICQDLAAGVGLGAKTWRAYLGADMPATDPKSRIGTGPWYNVKGVKIADNVDGLHGMAGNFLSGPNGIDEKGAAVPTGNPQQHDILTGANADGTLAAGKTCTNWTGMGVGRVGHFNKAGGGQNPTSWNSAHDSSGCTAANLVSTGGAGRFYCFATTP